MRGFRWPPPPDSGPRTWGPGPGGPRTGRPALPEPDTDLVATPHGVQLERLVTGTGDPVTVFAHGLGNGIATTRPFGSGVTGRKVFFQFRGHGRSEAPNGPWTYTDLARDLRAIADLGGASRAFGASLGAGALCRLLTESPDRFEKLVFFLPAVLDQPRGPVAADRITDLLEAVESGDASAVADVVTLELPAGVRNTPAGWAYLRQRLDQLLRDGLAGSLADLAAQTPLRDVTDLAAVTAPALVIANAGDDLHPVEVAERLAAALPQATLHVYDRPGVLWSERADLRDRVAGFLNE
ncbi:alpha/beta hydrolase [Micromonospora sp. WMMD1155]|uniref:alpha/beta fold hydrolase n=1 Tax=Micromonospora sp. WMMD1155 TaxID=3016094 RepID=UPI00249B8AD8|nr:alpha/beta hydrolase [Micromonospora sp. WMMD1155]WFE51574.1 alpha/beta hydrolase [Micromonospora sp. WMMD1155]